MYRRWKPLLLSPKLGLRFPFGQLSSPTLLEKDILWQEFVN